MRSLRFVSSPVVGAVPVRAGVLGALVLTVCGLGFAPRSASASWAQSNRIWPMSTLSVCWTTPGHDQEKAWVKEAVEDSWASVSALRFTGWGTCASGPLNPTNIRIQVGCNGGSTGNQCIAKIGTEATGVPHTMQTMMIPDKDVPIGCPAGVSKEICVKGISMHEMGHALGLVHEQNRTDRPGTCAPDSSNIVLGDAAGLVGEFDDESIMASGAGCNIPGTTGVWFNNGLLGRTDIMAAMKWYGAGTAPVILESGSERQISKMTPTGAYSFVSLQTGTFKDIVIRGGRNNTAIFYDPTIALGGRATPGLLDDSAVLTTGIPQVVGLNWTDITAVQGGYFIFYANNQEGGLVSVRRVNAKGVMSGELAHLPNQGTNWKKVVGLPNGAILFYDSVALTGRTARLNVLGNQLISGVNLSGFFFFDRLAAVNANTVLFIQGSTTGNAVTQISTINELGTASFVTFVSGVPGSVGAVAGSRNGSVLLYDTTAGRSSGSITGKTATITPAGVFTFGQTLTDFHSFNYGNIAAD